jgi:hypothetical protein
MAELKYTFAPLPHDTVELNDTLRRIAINLETLTNFIQADTAAGFSTLDQMIASQLGGNGPADVGVTDDLRFPASAINPLGQASDPDYDSALGGWLFAANVEQVVSVMAQLPHAWKEGTAITPHVHWTKTTSTAGDVVWQLQYKLASIGEVIDANWTTLTEWQPVASTPDNDLTEEHLITSFGDVDMSGRHISDMVLMRLSRLGGDASDTYSGEARLLEFDLHILKDSLGSAQPFTKA